LYIVLVSPAPTPAERTALRTLQLGAIAVALAASPYKLFELDRFFLPKELVLHACAAIVAVLCIARRPEPSRAWIVDDAPVPQPPGATWPDVALAVFLALSLASAFAAQNPWIAGRALTITLSGAALFWGARHLARRGHADAVVMASAAGCAVAAITSLLQAYGVETEYFSLNRAPGGTFGNRNFVAHLAAIGVPLLVYAGLRARGALGTIAATLGLVATSGALVMSRSRGAWLATAASLVPLAVGLWRARRLAGRVPKTTRLGLLGVGVVLGAVGSLMLPNTLNWKSDNPYLESAKGLVDYKSGSGRGRLKQYTNSAHMAQAHPLLGVGTGNWSVRYPQYAPDGDPSLVDGGLTANPWPSSDWVAVLSERGFPALAAIGLTMLGLLLWAHRAVYRAFTAEEALAGGVLGATIAAAVVVGAFDAVLLLAAPAFLVWTALGALAEASGAPAVARRVRAPSREVRRFGAIALGVVLAASALRATGQTIAMALFNTGRASAVGLAARLDPGNYRVRVRQAELAAQRGRCADVRESAGAARELFPSAAAPRRLLAACGGTRRRR
jgi:O-antigen ligase